MSEKAIKCYILPLPQLSYIYWLIHFKLHASRISSIQLEQKNFGYKWCSISIIFTLNDVKEAAKAELNGPGKLLEYRAISDFHKLITTFLRSQFCRIKPKKNYYRNFKNFNEKNFLEEVKNRLQIQFRQSEWKLPSKHLLLLKTSSRYVLKTSSTRLQRNNFSSSMTSWKRLEDF